MLEKWLNKRIGTEIGTEGAQMGADDRSAWGKAASAVGVACNALLFAGKMLVGVLSGSVAIVADAVNNLSDASSSIVSLLGFKMAGKPADAEHPYGHGRYEYLSGLMIAVMILVIGVELMQGSVEKMLHPTPVAMSGATVAVLVMSILIKLWMCRFNRRIGRRIGSKTLLATADDSRNDVISTAAVLASTLIGHFTGLMLDGYMGAIVAAFILVSGFSLVKGTIDPLLGGAPDKAQIDRVRAKILSYPGVLGMHDLILHDYGPGRQFASVHVEMDADEDPLTAHDLIDNIERDFMEQEKLHLVIHYDPVATGDPRVAVMRAFIEDVVHEIHPQMSIHDLRIVPGNTHTNVVFDCIVPYDVTMSAAQIRAQIDGAVREQYPRYNCVATLERSFNA